MKIYGLWDVEKSNGGPSTPKKSRVSSSSESDEEARVAPRSAKEDTQFEDVCDDCPAGFDSDGTDTESVTLKVINSV